jgi:hypothetical protein
VNIVGGVPGACFLYVFMIKIAALGHLKRVTESKCIQAIKKLVFDFLTIQKVGKNFTK